MQQLAKYLENYSLKLGAYLDKHIEQKIIESLAIDPKLPDLYKYLHQYIMGGKKIRGALVELGFEMYSKQPNPEITNVSAAIEIIHSGLLIQDDWIDRDETRRNLQSAHLKFSPEIAVVLGDLAYFEAYRMVAEAKFADSQKMAAFSLLSKYLANTGLGEILDVMGGNAEVVHIYKTAHYSFVMPLSLGALLGGVNKKDLETLKKYGEAVGLAFQIRDDILNIIGDPKITGKSILSDITSKKQTHIWKLAMAKNAFNPNTDTPEQIRDKFVACGAIDEAQALAQDYANTANKLVDNKILLELADFVVARDK